MEFYKYHSLGNDYILLDAMDKPLALSQEDIRMLCHRHMGIGADGIIVIEPSERAVCSMTNYNPDGSEAEKSGNGLRIFARYLFEKEYVTAKDFSIATSGGIVDAHIVDERANLIRIKMGKITFLSTEIPVNGDPRQVVDEDLEINGTTYKVTCLSIGNPHCVLPTEDLSAENARELGPRVENHEMFPNRINMQLLKVIDRRNIEIRIWERGASYTLASGSSACAAAGAAHKLGLVDEKIDVEMPGGSLLVEIGADRAIDLTGPVEGVFEGRFHRDMKDRIYGK